MRRRLPCLLLALLTAAIAAGCGKRGAPLAPIRIVPGAVVNMTARRTGDEIRIAFSVPAVNSDNSTPAVVAAVEIYAAAGPPAITLPAPMAVPVVELLVPLQFVVPPPAVPVVPVVARPGVPAPVGPAPILISRFPPVQLFDPTATGQSARSRKAPLPSTVAEIMVSKYRQHRIEVRPAPPPVTPAGEVAEGAVAPPPPDPTAAPPDPRPTPGADTTYSTQVSAQRAAAAASPDQSVYRMVVVGVTRGRRLGSPSALLEFPLGSEIPAPKDPVVAYDATLLKLTWTAGAPSQSYRVYKTDRNGKEEIKPLNPAPLAVETFSAPVEFGAEQCFAIRAVVVRGAASNESPATPPICVSAVDTFPPVAPTGLTALPTETQVQLLWNAVTAVDLAGYLVLRGVDGAAPEPLMTVPITTTSYTDAAIRPGVRFTYVVVAVDAAGNRSLPSNQVEEAR